MFLLLRARKSVTTLTEKTNDFVKISVSASELTACTARSGMLAGVPILGLDGRITENAL